MKKMLTVAAMLMVMAGAASAQGGGGGGGGGGRGTPEQMLQRNMDRLFKDITLTDAQKTKATVILKASAEANAGLDRQAADYRDKMTAANNKRNADLKAILTSDADKAKFDANAAAPQGRRGGQ
jgi:Spy/CpxP family protein refolding chaperone